MSVRPLFPTLFYEGTVTDDALLDELERSCRLLATEDKAGRRWSKDHGYTGYTSYASLDDLPRRDPAFADLARVLDRHVAGFVKDVGWDMPRKPKLDSLWVNVMRRGATHSGHLHPHSAISGTVYIAVPEGAGALRLEDPRLPMMMAAPMRDHFHHAHPTRGTVFLWESWLRHEVMPHAGREDRISISFNYR